MRSLSGLLLVLLWLVAPPAWAQDAEPPAAAPEEDQGPVEVRGSVDRALIAPGDTLTWTVIVRHPTTVDVQVPAFGAAVRGLVVSDYQRPDPTTVGEVVEHRWVHELRGDIAGTFELPPMPVVWTAADGAEGTAWTGQILVTVSGDVASDEDLLSEGLRDLQPAIRPDRDLRPYALGALAFLALLALAGAARWWIRRGVEEPVLPPRPADELALEALAALDAGGTLDQDPRLFCFELSRILRAYLEARFAFPALEWTTGEIESGMPEDALLTIPLRASIGKVLSECDLVKFAGQAGVREVLLDLRERVARVVRETPLPEPDTEEEAA